MTEDEKNHEKLATMQELSETNDLLECLKGRMEQWSAKYVVFRGIEGRTTKPNTLYRCNRQ